jgi:hypothetical protein
MCIDLCIKKDYDNVYRNYDIACYIEKTVRPGLMGFLAFTDTSAKEA